MQANGKRVHFMGIGGTGMVAAARLAVDAGWEVRGSDNPLYPPTSEMVAALEVPVAEGYAPENLEWGPDLVVVGNALSRGNAEVEALLEKRLHYVSMAEWLKDAVLRERRPIVITGTHGKTTTTALTAYLLDQTGHDPGYLIGGQPLDFEHSSRLGPEGGPFVIEGDEYDSAFFDKRAKFFHYLPELAVVTSLEFDHGDIYDTIEDIELAFQRMLRQIPKSGTLLVCADAPRALALRKDALCQVQSYGFHKKADWRIESLGLNETHHRFSLRHDGKMAGEFDSPIFGNHNIQNAAAAMIAAHLQGAPLKELGKALSRFKGIRRRMEVFHEARGSLFIDDFAHHPTAIHETLGAARMRWPDRRLVVLFEPRSNTTVTNRFQADLTEAFTQVDELHIGPIHRVDAIPEELRLDRDGMCRDLKSVDVFGRYCDEVDDIVSYLEESIEEGEIVLVLSNGAFGGIYDLIKTRITEQV